MKPVFISLFIIYNLKRAAYCLRGSLSLVSGETGMNKRNWKELVSTGWHSFVRDDVNLVQRVVVDDEPAGPANLEPVAGNLGRFLSAEPKQVQKACRCGLWCWYDEPEGT